MGNGIDPVATCTSAFAQALTDDEDMTTEWLIATGLIEIGFFYVHRTN